MSAIKNVKAVINGQEYTLTYNASTQSFEASITAPSSSSYTVNSGHYYPVTVTAEDVAGNRTSVDDTDTTLGASLRLKVKEKVAPTVKITSIGNGATVATNTPSIIFEVKDNDSGVDKASVTLKIDDKAVTLSEPATIDGGYKYTYAPASGLSDATHTIKINASDNDGNSSATESVTFKVDTTPPTLNITSPTNNAWTNQTKVTVEGTTNDAISSPCTVKITVNDVDAGSVTVATNGAFTKEITLKEGTNVITITSTDKIGKVTTVTRTVNLDTTKPVFTSISCTPNPVDSGATYKITVKVKS